MKKIRMAFALMLLCTMLTVSAHAVEVVCVQIYAPGADWEYSVMQAKLDNGQIVYYLNMSSEPRYIMEDVNFDGHDDFVPTTAMGASNFFSAFFLYNPQSGQYEPVYTVDQGFCNYTLMPEKGYVISSVNDGWRNRDIKVYQWQEGSLVLIRRATVSDLHTVEFEDAGMIERWDFSQNEMIIHDYTTGEEGGQVIFQETYPGDDSQVEEHLAALDAALWEGL